MLFLISNLSLATLSRDDRNMIREDLLSKGFNIPNYASSSSSDETLIDIGSQFDTFSVRSDNIQYGQSITSQNQPSSVTTDGNWATTINSSTTYCDMDVSSTTSGSNDLDTVSDVIGVNDNHEGVNFELLLSRDFNSCTIHDDTNIQQCKAFF